MLRIAMEIWFNLGKITPYSATHVLETWTTTVGVHPYATCLFVSCFLAGIPLCASANESFFKRWTWHCQSQTRIKVRLVDQFVILSSTFSMYLSVFKNFINSKVRIYFPAQKLYTNLKQSSKVRISFSGSWPSSPTWSMPQ